MEDWKEFVETFGQNVELYNRLQQVKIDLGISWTEIDKLLVANVDLNKGVITIPVSRQKDCFIGWEE